LGLHCKDRRKRSLHRKKDLSHSPIRMELVQRHRKDLFHKDRKQRFLRRKSDHKQRCHSKSFLLRNRFHPKVDATGRRQSFVRRG
jgi:hypothetical protein